jgi:hypothetical protein
VRGELLDSDELEDGGRRKEVGAVRNLEGGETRRRELAVKFPSYERTREKREGGRGGISNCL